MMRARWIIIGGLTASNAAAQALACDKGPGIPLGVLEYSCANCTSSRPAGQRKSYVFASEPVVVERASGSPFEAGDAIVSVDNHSIKSPEGADAFAYPKHGPVLLQIRRGDAKSSHLLYTLVSVTKDCDFEAGTPASATVPKVTTADSVDGRLVTDDYAMQLGFKVVCMSTCTEAMTDDGKRYWIYRDPPSLANVRTTGAAYQIGFRDGDIITEVNGTSILEQKGQLKLTSPGRGERLTLKLLRDGKPKTLRISFPFYDGSEDPRSCQVPTIIVVRNDSGRSIDAYVDIGGSRRFVGTVQSGRQDFPHPSVQPGQSVSYGWELTNPNEKVGITWANDAKRISVAGACRD